MIDDDDIIKPINDRDEIDEERSREHYREFNARAVAICEDKGLTDAHSRVLWRLMLHFNHKTGQCDPSLRGLAERLGYSPATIVNAVKAAQARGHLDWPANPGGTKRRNQYVFLKPTETFNGTFKRSTPVQRSVSADRKRSTAVSGTFNGDEPKRSTATQRNVQPPSIRTTEENYEEENYEYKDPLASRAARTTEEAKARKQARRLPREASRNTLPYSNASKTALPTLSAWTTTPG